MQLYTQQTATRRGARAKAEVVVDRALAGADASVADKARAKRRLTRVSKEMRGK